MTDLHTNEALLLKLKASASKTLTADDILKQRISYVMGTLKADGPATRERVRAVLSFQDGNKNAA
jgi:hypothetical protein